ncbi:MAG: alpha/beta hydrolase [Betaproteobacteria bacterium]|nr:alpha/beta hydrolase [Betaproteobacteria bacterium]MBA3775105.1 alpha/beta hydrolase [Betaproteobacteria bacterium]
MKESRSQFVPIRGLRYHIRTWGDPHSPKLFLLHGWMDVSASFQFLVDALRREWCVFAPDWRGFGLTEWPQDGYWFADYLADLDALVRALASDEKVVLAGHSLGGNIALLYAGLRVDRVRRIVSLDGFGIPAEDEGRASEKLTAWLDALAEPPAFAPYADFAAVADRLQKNNPRLARDRAAFLATHWAAQQADGSLRLRADPRHKLPFPTVYHLEEAFAIWRKIAAPTLWVAASESRIPKWLAKGAGGAEEVARRMAHIPGARLVTIENAGHMLHHDQPEAVAAALEPFLGAVRNEMRVSK